ncbi:MAG: ferrous iron transporter B [Clostridiales Family XIII bacterium]|jgi:ferrous iron transport protein B|nr:ferrous iron transporter B [Clostridiales Family XIII bacterium]
MSVKIALAGNPNSGKTTLFNGLTGSNQSVGNWPGVTVEKKEGKLRNSKDVTIVDLPGIYSMSPYTLEEVIARNYLIDERPDAILNIIDGTNLERNLYLTTQLTELGIPVVAVVNMMDIVRKSGDRIDTAKLSKGIGCKVVEVSALKGEGIMAAAAVAVEMAQGGKTIPQHSFSGSVEHALAHIEEAVLHDMPEERQRWFAIKLFERDGKIAEKLGMKQESLNHIEHDIEACEAELDDDSESIITSERYAYIGALINECCRIKDRGKLSASDRIDRVVTNRWLALPIFAVVMFTVYFVSVTSVGAIATDWANEGVFGDGWRLFGIGTDAYEAAYGDFEAGIAEEPDPASFGAWIPGVPVVLEGLLDAVGSPGWLKELMLDGIVAGVGAVLGFVPQMLILFAFLAFLEACGYMARIAFIMDKVFRRFGLSGKSFIPILIGTGCGVPGIMASRTIECECDRRMTIMTTTFIPCGAKLPIIALIAGALFDGAWWVAPSAYFVGIAAIICSGVILKKTKLFAGSTAPFVMELPSYHMPTPGNILRSMWERGWSFIRKAGTIILLATIFVWFASNFGFVDGGFGKTEMQGSILAVFGTYLAWIFVPLGWGDWRSAVAAITGLIAKENIVGTFGILYGFAEVAEDGAEIWVSLSSAMTPLAAYSFLVFNLLCAPCFAAIGAIRREMNNRKWFWAAIGYQCVFAYAAALCIYQIGRIASGGGLGIGSAVAAIIVAMFAYLLFRSAKEQGEAGEMNFSAS